MRDPYVDEATSQFPVQPPAAPPAWRSFLRRHQGPLIVVAAAAAAALTGGAGWAVAETASTPAPSPTASTPPSHHAAAADTVRGTVQSEAGDTWTVRTGTGTTVTVTITAKTRFGRKNASSSAADFPVGAAVVITGRTHDSTLTANRVSAPASSSPAPSKATA